MSIIDQQPKTGGVSKSEKKRDSALQEAIALAESMLESEIWDQEKFERMMKKLERGKISDEMYRRLSLHWASVETLLKRYDINTEDQQKKKVDSENAFNIGNWALVGSFAVPGIKTILSVVIAWYYAKAIGIYFGKKIAASHGKEMEEEIARRQKNVDF